MHQACATSKDTPASSFCREINAKRSFETISHQFFSSLLLLRVKWNCSTEQQRAVHFLSLLVRECKYFFWHGVIFATAKGALAFYLVNAVEAISLPLETLVGVCVCVSKSQNKKPTTLSLSSSCKRVSWLFLHFSAFCVYNCVHKTRFFFFFYFINKLF